MGCTSSTNQAVTKPNEITSVNKPQVSLNDTNSSTVSVTVASPNNEGQIDSTNDVATENIVLEIKEKSTEVSTEVTDNVTNISTQSENNSSSENAQVNQSSSIPIVTDIITETSTNSSASPSKLDGAGTPKLKKVTFEEPKQEEDESNEVEVTTVVDVKTTEEETVNAESPQPVSEDSQNSAKNEVSTTVVEVETVTHSNGKEQNAINLNDTAVVHETTPTDSANIEGANTVPSVPVEDNKKPADTVLPGTPDTKARRATTNDIEKNIHASPLEKLRSRSSVVGPITTVKPTVANINRGSLHEKEGKKIHDTSATIENKIVKVKKEIEETDASSDENKEKVKTTKDKELELREEQKTILQSKEQALNASPNANELELRKILKPFDEQMKAYDNACWQLHAALQAVTEEEEDFYRQSAEAYIQEATEIKNNNVEESKKHKALAEKHIQSALQARNEK